MKRRRKPGARLLANYRPLSNPLTAVDVGDFAEIEIAQFTMAVGGEHIENNSGAILFAAHDTLYYVYYDDPHLSARGDQAYTATTDAITGIAGRFFVGSITTPTNGGPPTRGNDDGGWGEYRSLAQLDHADSHEGKVYSTGENPQHAKTAPEKPETKRSVKGVRPPKNAKPVELNRLRRIRRAIDQGFRAIFYCQELDRDGVSPRRAWIEDGCPNKYAVGYRDKKWRKKIQQEKWRVSRMSGLQG